MLLGKGAVMNAGCCRKRAAGGALAFLLPGVAWLVMPKCPVCLAAYLALFTGLGVTATMAEGLRVLVISVTCAAAFLFAIRLLKRHKQAKP